MSNERTENERTEAWERAARRRDIALVELRAATSEAIAQIERDFADEIARALR